MLFPGFTPAWPRTTAYVPKPLLLSILYFQFSLLRLTFARDTGSVEQEDHNHPRLLNFAQQPEGLAGVELLQNEHEENYEPVFLGLDRSIIGRAPPEIQTLGNNAPAQSKVIKKGGSPHYWIFPKEVLFGPRAPAATGLLFEENPRSLNYSTATRDTSIENEEIDRSKRQNTSSTKRLLYITLTTCDGPLLKTSTIRDEAPGGLELYVSMTSNNRKPTSTNHDHVVEVIGGFGAINLQASDDVFFAVAPKSEEFDGSYTYELTASIDAPFAAYNDGGNSNSMSRNDFIFFIDSDSDSALFDSNFTTTENSSSPVFQQVMDNPPPYSIFLHNEDDSSIIGVQNSLCGLKRKAQILLNGKGNGTDSTDGMNSTNGTTKMFSMIVQDGRRPAQQFHVTGLNASSSYYAIMAVEGNSTAAGSGVVRGGGTVGKSIKFKTKSGSASLSSSLFFIATR